MVAVGVLKTVIVRTPFLPSFLPSHQDRLTCCHFNLTTSFKVRFCTNSNVLSAGDDSLSQPPPPSCVVLDAVVVVDTD
jgi:hypothetical protein